MFFKKKIIMFFIFAMNFNRILSLEIVNTLAEEAAINTNDTIGGKCIALAGWWSQDDLRQQIKPHSTINLKNNFLKDLNLKLYFRNIDEAAKKACTLYTEILDDPKVKVWTSGGSTTVDNPTAYIQKINDNRYEIRPKEDFRSTSQQMEKHIYDSRTAYEEKQKAIEDATNNLWMAISDKDKNGVIQALAQGAKIESTQAGMTPLMMAVANLDVPITQELLKNKANVKFKVESGDSQGLFPLALAAMAQKNADLPSSLQIINLLGSYGARADFPQWGYQNMDLGKLAYENVKMLEEGGDPVLNLPLTIKEDILMALENLGARPELWEFDRCQDWRNY